MGVTMKYVLSVLFLAMLSGILCAEEFTITKGQSFSIFTVTRGVPLVLPATAPTAGRHKCMVCEGSGCGCGCRSGGACTCHPGWRPSAGTWWFYRDRGVEIGAYDQSTGMYWQKYTDGSWRERIEPKKEEVRLEPQFFRSSGRKC